MWVDFQQNNNCMSQISAHVHALSHPIINTLMCISVKAVHPHSGRDTITWNKEQKTKQESEVVHLTPQLKMPPHISLCFLLKVLLPPPPSDF